MHDYLSAAKIALIGCAEASYAELAERVKAAEAEVERLADWKASALPVMTGLQELGKSLGLPLGARITGPLAFVAAEALNARAEAAEATIARVRALAEEHPGTAWNSGLNLRQALRDALGGTPTDATEGASSADDERNRFSGEDTDEPTQPILRPTDQRYEPPADDHESGCCR